MTLLDYLKNVSEQRYEPSFDEFPMYIVNRFFTFSMRPCSIVLNRYVNHQHWHESDSELQQKLLHKVLPKRQYHYGKLFGSYVKKPVEKRDDKFEECLDYVKKYFMVNSKEATEYLKNEEFRQEVESRI